MKTEPNKVTLYIQHGCVTVNIAHVVASPQGQATLAKIAKIREQMKDNEVV